MRAVWLSALVILIADQASKLYVLRVLDLAEVGRVEVLPPYLVFQMLWNRGINFGLFAGGAEALRWGLVAVALVISAAVFIWMRRGAHPVAACVSAGALIGGALGNVIDRIAYGAVADFLNMSCCGFTNPYSFNVADIAIFAGAAGLVIWAGDGSGKAGAADGGPGHGGPGDDGRAPPPGA